VERERSMVERTIVSTAFRELRVETDDGFPLAVRHFPSKTLAHDRAVILLNATGVTQTRFASLAEYLARCGWHAITFDYRSIGESIVPADMHGTVSMRAWGVHDLTAVINWVTHTLGCERLAVIAHSIGGQIVPLAANANRISAMLAVASQKGYWRLWPGWRRYVVWGFFRCIIPFCLKILGYVPLGWIGLNRLQRGVAEDYARWTLRADYLDDAGCSLHSAHENFRAPILSVSFEDDPAAPLLTVDYLVRHFYVNAPVLRAHIEHTKYGLITLGHSGFFDPNRCPQEFWHDASGWLHHILNGGTPYTFEFQALPAKQFEHNLDMDTHERCLVPTSTAAAE